MLLRERVPIMHVVVRGHVVLRAGFTLFIASAASSVLASTRKHTQAAFYDVAIAVSQQRVGMGC